MHSIVLATILELCDNTNTVSHILSWRNGDGQTAPGLLLQLWREEEAELGVSRSQNGEIAGQSAAKDFTQSAKNKIVRNFFCLEVH